MEASATQRLLIMKTLLLLSLLICPLCHALTYEAWIASHGLTGPSAAHEADPDKDGITNLVEFALASGHPTTPGPWDNAPRLGFATRLPDGGMSEATSVQEPGNPYGSHLCLTFTPRPEIEDVALLPEVSMKQSNVMSLSESSLKVWYGGSSVIRIDSLPTGALQASCRLRAGQWPRGFMRLNVLTGEGLSTQAAEGVVQPNLVFQPVTRIYRVVGSQTSTSITDRDVIYQQVSAPLQVSDIRWSFTAGNTGYSAGQMVRSSTNTGVITPHGSDASSWTYVSDGTATLRVTTPARTYEAEVTTNSLTSVVSNTQTGNVAGSLRAHLVTQTEGRMSAFANIAERNIVYSSASSSVPSYTRATSCWLNTANLTPVSSWSTNGWRYTLVSPRHCITALHCVSGPGDTVHFVAGDNTVTVRTIAAVSPVAGTDIQVCALNADVPAGIAFARVLPDAWASKLPTLAIAGVVCCNWDQGQRVFARDLRSLGALADTTQPPTGTARAIYYSETRAGDSSSPCFLVISDSMVLLTTWYSGGQTGARGPFLTTYRTQINAAMSALGGGYSLSDVNLSAFTSY